MWFFLSPQMRYGGHGIIGGTLIFYISLIISKNEISFKKFRTVMLILITISGSFYYYKNTSRIIKSLNENQFNNFPWPKYEKNKYRKII